ncbi:MAG: nucleoside monophosphate kinase [Verrucomicrobiota bacterium]
MRVVKYRAVLLFGAPGSGKGTQGTILGTIPGFHHCACGDVFRALDYGSALGQKFAEYSARGELVPDDITIELWSSQIANMVQLRRYKPEIDLLALDGIPRSVRQAELLQQHLDVHHVFHLSCPDRGKLVDRLKRRALKENRLDDANEEVIRNRLSSYEEQTKPVLDFYVRTFGPDIVTQVDATQWPYQVLRFILEHLEDSQRRARSPVFAGSQSVPA